MNTVKKFTKEKLAQRDREPLRKEWETEVQCTGNGKFRHPPPPQFIDQIGGVKIWWNRIYRFPLSIVHATCNYSQF